MYLRIPKPSYLRSHLSPRRAADAALLRDVKHLAELYQLGPIESCWLAPQSVNSVATIATAPAGTFVFKRHRLSEETVAHEHQIMLYLQQHNFSSPRVLINAQGQAWSAVGDSLYSVYEFAEGYCPADFIWWPAARRSYLREVGHTLGRYHQVMEGFVPTHYKWDGYRPAEHRRWREGDWFRDALIDIRARLKQPTAISELDDFARSTIDAFAHMIELEDMVESRTDLSKLVIHGDYAPWNILLRNDQPPLVLDFNGARLDLKIYDVVFATFWFAWRRGTLDSGRAIAFQQGYSASGALREVDLELASPVFRWIIARAVVERLRRHYQENVSPKSVNGLKEFYNMCVFAEQYPEQLMQGLQRIVQAVR